MIEGLGVLMRRRRFFTKGVVLSVISESVPYVHKD